VLFMMNNAAGPDEFIQALGAERVLIGFPSSGGMRKGDAIVYLGGSPQAVVTIPFGEVDGSTRQRTLEVAEILRSMPGYDANIRPDMDAWLKTHVALLMPGLVPALYACNTDLLRLANTRDALVLGIRATREAFRVLQALGIPITPPNLDLIFGKLPEPLLVSLLQKILRRPQMEIALTGHALAAPDELKHLTDEFMVFARQSGIPTPNIERLYAYFDPATPRMPPGRATIPMDYRSIAIGLGVLAGLLGGIWLVTRKRK
jgi:2-dehydropantoate 2-reductase